MKKMQVPAFHQRGNHESAASAGKVKSRGCMKEPHFANQQGAGLDIVQWGGGEMCSWGILATQTKIVTSIIYLPKPETCLHFRHLL